MKTLKAIGIFFLVLTAVMALWVGIVVHRMNNVLAEDHNLLPALIQRDHVASEELSDEEFAELAGMLFIYDRKCGGLPNNAGMLSIGMMMKAKDPFVKPAARKIHNWIDSIGIEKWCAEMRKPVDLIDQQQKN